MWRHSRALPTWTPSCRLQDSHYGGYFTFEYNILRDGGVWPNYRREWEFRGEKVTRLMNVPLEIKQAIALLYQLRSTC